MKTFSNGTVAKDPTTGRFVSVKSMKPMHAKTTKAPRLSLIYWDQYRPHNTYSILYKVEEPALKVISALYGIEGTRVEMASVNPGKKLNNKMAGNDPAPGTKKDAIIKVEINGSEVEKTFAEGEVINF